MSPSRKAFLRSIMQTAWDFRRAEPGRAFADCLRGAWKIIRGLRAAGRNLMARKGARGIQLSPLLYRSPSVNVAGGDRHGAYLAARGIALAGR